MRVLVRLLLVNIVKARNKITISILFENKKTFLSMVFFITVPAEFLWSEWGLPDKLCDVGTQKRTTMCGSLRRRLPNKVGRDSDDPAGNIDIE